MARPTALPAQPHRQKPIPDVLIATTAMLTFISFWRAAAVVLNDMASSKEIDLLHDVWLGLSGELAPEELHHHDIVHFSLEKLREDLGREPEHDAIVRGLRDHIRAIRRPPDSSGNRASSTLAEVPACGRPC
jgi:hypothetical protein